METLRECELVDYLESCGGEVRGLSCQPTAPHWRSCNYLIRGYDGVLDKVSGMPEKMQRGELIQSEKVKKAEKLHRAYETGDGRSKRDKPLVILENERDGVTIDQRSSGYRHGDQSRNNLMHETKAKLGTGMMCCNNCPSRGCKACPTYLNQP